MKSRAEWIDRLRGLLISFVVLGHVVGGAGHLAGAGLSGMYSLFYAMIYIFHMPAFFCLAGMTWKSPASEFGSFFSKKGLRLVVPYLVWGVFSVIVYLLFSTHAVSAVSNGATDAYYAHIGNAATAWWMPFVSLAHGGGWPNGGGFRCNSVLWFFPCLFSVEMIYWLVDRYMPSFKAQLIVLVVCFALGFWMRCHLSWRVLLPWGLGRVPEYMTFFWIGKWLVEKKEIFVPKGSSKAWRWMLLVMMTVGYLTVCCYMPNLFEGFVSWWWYVGFALMACWGIVVSIGWAQLLPGRLLTLIGVSSMGIMVLHKFIVVALQMKIPFIQALTRGSMSLSFSISSAVFVIALFGSWGATVAVRCFCPWLIGERRVGAL